MELVSLVVSYYLLLCFPYGATIKECLNKETKTGTKTTWCRQWWSV